MFRFILIATIAVASVAAFGNPEDVHAQITKQASDIDEHGHYNNQWETSNGISVQESGIGGHHATGGYAYYSPEGKLVQVSYLADENGFQPQSEWLPTPPPIPAAILKSLEYIRTHPQYEEPQHQQHEYRQPSVQVQRRVAAPQRNVFQSRRHF